MDEAIKGTIKKVEKWLKDDYSQETKRKLRSWVEKRDFDLINEAFGKNIEWSDGGVLAKTGLGSGKINHYTVSALAQAFANFLKDKSNGNGQLLIVVAYDNREQSNYFAQIIAETLSANRIDVKFFGILTPLPVLAHAIGYFGCDGGLMVTGGSHNKEYNGITFLDASGFEFTRNKGQQVIKALRKIRRRTNIKQQPDYRRIEFVPEEVEKDYMWDLKQSFLYSQSAKNAKICYTPWYGTGTVVGPALLEAAGYEITLMDEHHVPSPDFGNLTPNPATQNALDTVFENAGNADIIIATNIDGTGISVAARTEKGILRQLNSHQVATLAVEYVLDKYRFKELPQLKKVILKSIPCSDLINVMAQYKNVPCKDDAEGLYSMLLNNSEVLLGVNEWGELLIPDISTVRDGFLYALIIAQIADEAKSHGKALWDLLYSHYEHDGIYVNEMAEVTLEKSKGNDPLKKIYKTYSEHPPHRINDSIVVNKIINYYKGSIIKPLTGEEKPFNGVKTGLLEFHLSDGSKIHIMFSHVTSIVRFFASHHQLVERIEDISQTEIILKNKLKRLIDFFKNYGI